MYANKLEARLLRFHGKGTDAYHLRAFHVKAALMRSGLNSAWSEDSVEYKATEKALFMYVTSFGGNSRPTIYSGKVEQDAWTTLNYLYSGESMMSKLGTLNKLLDSQYDGTADNEDHVSKVESEFSRLEAWDLKLE